MISIPEEVGRAGLLVANAVSNLEVPELAVGAVLGLLDASSDASDISVPDEADSASLGLLLTAAADCVVELSVGANVSGAAHALAGCVVPNLVIKAGLRRAGALAAASVPVFVIGATFRVGVANAAAFFDTPEGFDWISTGVRNEAIALTGGLEAVALAAHVVKDIVFRAHLGDATASAAIGIVLFGEIASVPVLVWTAFLRSTSTEAVTSIEIVADWAVSVQDTASAVFSAVEESLSLGIEGRAGLVNVLHAVP